jgi:protein SCO1
MLRILVVSLVLLVAAITWRPEARRDAAPTTDATILPQTRALPAVAFVDQNGAPFSLDSLHGDFVLLFFGFTNCPDVCPLTLKVLADARAELAARAPAAMPKVVFVSVDSARDTPERIAAYLRNFDAEIIGVTASESELQPLLQTFGVTVQKHDHGGGSYTVVHNGAIFFVGPRTEWIAVSSGPHDPKTVAADYLKVRQRYRPTPATPKA